MELNYKILESSYAYKDSSEGYAILSPGTSQILSFMLKKPFGAHHISLNGSLARDVGFSEAGIKYEHVRDHLSIFTGAHYGVNAFNLSFGDEINDFLGQINHQPLCGFIGGTFRSKFGAGYIEYKRASLTEPLMNGSHDFDVMVHPYQSSIALDYRYSLSADLQLIFAYENSSDTANATIYRSSGSIGKLYALDHSTQTISVGLEYGKISPQIRSRRLQGELRGYVYASPFGSLISLLSGARYNHRLLVDLSMVDFQLALTDIQIGPANVLLSNVCYFGSGSVESRHYIYQLFNPVTDLSVSAMTLNRFIINDLNVSIEASISEQAQLSFGIGQIIPLYVDYKLYPLEDIEQIKGSIYPRLNLALMYNFK